ncbi:MAG: triose-phosphate isomerase [Planctomycetota bacterium]
MTRRRKFIAGNWKMNLNRASAHQLASGLAQRLADVTDVDIAVCPPFPYLCDVHDAISGSRLQLGAQNAYFEKSGAFTGEVSNEMLADVGCKYVILGHSERRHVLCETDEVINRKLTATLRSGLKPIFCVGELLEQREANKTNEVVGNQLRHGLVGVAIEQMRDVTIAYEPVWAIGTGKVATPEQAEDVHAFIRESLTKMYGNDLAQDIRIQYGGSVKGDNALGLLTKPNVDGALVGGASLKVDDFSDIVRAGVQASH